MSQIFACWKCGQSLADLLVPLPRLAECPDCRAELHVCRMCVWFDRAAANQCREPVADPVTDKERANFCGYFQPSAHAFAAPSGEAADARRRLDALFGAPAPGDAAEEKSPEAAAREQLEKLFRK